MTPIPIAARDPTDAIRRSLRWIPLARFRSLRELAWFRSLRELAWFRSLRELAWFRSLRELAWWQVRRLAQEKARLLEVCERMFRRYVDRCEDEGFDGLLDKRLGQVSARRAPAGEGVRTEALHRERMTRR